MRRQGARLSELRGIFTPAPQTLINVDVRAKPDLSAVPELQAAIADAERHLAGKGRVLVRYSGTQPLCRVMVEASTEALTRSIGAELEAKVREMLG